MAGSTVSLQTVDGFVQYINTKAGVEAGIYDLGSSSEIDAYANGDGKSIILPYHYKFSGITLPTKESDGTTASNKTFTVYNAFRMRISVTYAGTANA